MKFLTTLICLLLAAGSLKAQEPIFNKKTRIYIVRHAEKEKGKDPVLTAMGASRAGMLMRKLQHKNIQRIYVTEYRRTQMTGDSIRIQLGIDTVHYVADTIGNDLLLKIKAHGDDGKTILVIGHSNTIPFIIRKLGVENYPLVNIADDVFDNLFIITYKKNKATLETYQYGAHNFSTQSTIPVTLKPMQ